MGLYADQRRDYESCAALLPSTLTSDDDDDNLNVEEALQFLGSMQVC
jgi:hypothetical protein